jgi:hypothetical protein
MKKNIILIFCIFFNLTISKGQNEDFESSISGSITVSNQITGWAITSGTNPNSCNIQNCCSQNPVVSEIITTPYIDPIIGNGYPIYSIFGSAPQNTLAMAANPQIKRGAYGNKIIRLNNSFALYGVETASKMFVVNPNNTLLMYAYILVSNGGDHVCCTAPNFQTRITDGGVTCDTYSTTVSGSLCTNSEPFFYSGSGGIQYNKWYCKTIDLSALIGHTVTIIFFSADCSAGGHFLYTYLDVGFAKDQIIINKDTVLTNSTNLNLLSCTAITTVAVTEGMTPYLWTGPGGFTSTNSAISTSLSGTYTVNFNSGLCSPSQNKILHLSIDPATLTISSSNSLHCPGNTVTLTATGMSAYNWNIGSSDSSIVINPFVTTTYSVTGTNISGCHITKSITHSVSIMPNVNIVTSDSVVCEGYSVAITGSGLPEYFWNTGATNSVIVVSPTISTTYFFVGYSNDGCPIKKSLLQFVDPCVGIIEQANSNELINIYPNPNNGTFIVAVPELTLPSYIVIYSAIGEVIERQTLKNTHNNIKLKCAPGIYYFSITNSSEAVKRGKFKIE